MPRRFSDFVWLRGRLVEEGEGRRRGGEGEGREREWGDIPNLPPRTCLPSFPSSSDDVDVSDDGDGDESETTNATREDVRRERLAEWVHEVLRMRGVAEVGAVREFFCLS